MSISRDGRPLQLECPIAYRKEQWALTTASRWRRASSCTHILRLEKRSSRRPHVNAHLRPPTLMDLTQKLDGVHRNERFNGRNDENPLFVPSTPSNDDRGIRPGAYRIGGSSNGSEDDSELSSLEDVVETSSEFEHETIPAELVEPAPLASVVLLRDERGRRKLRLLFLLCVVISIIIASVVIGVTVGNDSQRGSSSAAIQANTTSPPISPPTRAPLPATPAPTWPERCFRKSEELFPAVDEYLADPGNQNSSVAQTYGWPIGNWCVSQIQDFSHVFSGQRRPAARTFNESLAGWDTSNAQSMTAMFFGATVFNQNLSSWDVSRVADMRFMMSQTDFNNDITSWDVSRVTTMASMFAFSKEFNQDLSSWNVSNVRNVNGMFNFAQSFNQDLSSWDVSGVTDFTEMFESAEKFNQSLCRWGDVIGSTTVIVSGMFRGTACPTGDEPDLMGDPAGPFCSQCS